MQEVSVWLLGDHVEIGGYEVCAVSGPRGKALSLVLGS